jgi:Protein of unknown function (DUF1569)
MPEQNNLATTSTREPLQFKTLEQVVERLEQLHRDGYRKLGNWNLAQTCEHLDDWMRYPINGYPKASLPIRMMLWAMRVSVGRSMLRKIITSGKMPRGGPTLKQTVYSSSGLQDATSMQKFSDTIRRFSNHRGPFHASPVFGPLSAEDSLKLQLVHCSHHLSFLVPESASQST